MRRFLLAAALAFASAPPADADTRSGTDAYLRGDYAAAYREFLPETLAGDASAQFNLGFMYLYGWGVAQDYAEAVKWYRRAAEQGDAPAQNNLGIMYADGRGVPQDYIQAHKWYNLAAARYLVEDRDKVVKNRDRVAARMTPAQIAAAQLLAREWQPRAETPRRTPLVEPFDPVGTSLIAVRDPQTLLAALGYDPGPADGIAGAKTRAAIRVFQHGAGLAADGEVSQQVIARARAAVAALRASSPARVD